MNKIIGNCHISTTNFEEFNKMLNDSIEKLQEDNMVVEIMYTTNIKPNGQVLYSALLIGKKSIME